MSQIRDEVRAILREEIAVLRGEIAGKAATQTENVRITGSADLNRFARDLVQRSADPEFAARILRGELMFDLAPDTVTHHAPIVTGSASSEPARLDKALVTERDIVALDASARSVRVARRSCLTPLARDEARRRGIRIERTEA